MPVVSFEKDIKPMFRPVDIAHMKPMGVELDDYGYMSDPNGNYANAAQVQDTLSPQNGAKPTMPPGGPYWTAEQLGAMGTSTRWGGGGKFVDGRDVCG
jgi:hypothetical protein